MMVAVLILTSCLKKSSSYPETLAPTDVMSFAFLKDELYQENMFDKNTIQVGQKIANMTVVYMEKDESGNISVQFEGETILSGHAYFMYDGYIEARLVIFFPDTDSLSYLPRMIGDYKNLWFVFWTDLPYIIFGPPDYIYTMTDFSPEAVEVTLPGPEQVLRTKATIKINDYIVSDARRIYNQAYLVDVISREQQETMDKPADFELNFYEHAILLDIPDQYTAIAQIITGRNDDGTSILGEYVILNYAKGMYLPDKYIGKEFVFTGNITRVSPLTVFIPRGDMWRGLFDCDV
jgi:hypothetical protein